MTCLVGRETGSEVGRRRLATLREYPWSSYRAYAGYASKPICLTGEELGRRATRKGQDKRTSYRRYVEDGLRQGVEEGFWDKAKVGMVLGGERFCETVRRLVHGDRREQREVREWERRGRGETVVRGVEKAKGEKWERFRDRQGDWGRDLALWIARRQCAYTLRELGEMAGGIEYPAVAKAVERIGSRLSLDGTLARLCAEVTEGMSNV